MSVYSQAECYHCPHYPRGCSLYYFTLGQEVKEIERNATMFEPEICPPGWKYFYIFLLKSHRGGLGSWKLVWREDPRIQDPGLSNTVGLL